MEILITTIISYTSKIKITKMKDNLVFSVLLSFLTLSMARPQADSDNYGDLNEMSNQFLGDAPEMKRECTGSVTLYEASENKTVLTRDEENIKPRLLVERAVVEGCGCFSLHTNKKGRGKMTFLQGPGETIMEGQLKVRSVRKVDCYRYNDVRNQISGTTKRSGKETKKIP